MTTSVTGPIAVTASTSTKLTAPATSSIYYPFVLLVNNSPFLAQITINAATDWLQPSDRAVYAVPENGSPVNVVFQQAPNGPATAPTGQPSFLTATWYDGTDSVPDTPPTPLGQPNVQITAGTVTIGTITGTVTVTGSVTVSGTVTVSSISGTVTVSGTVNVGTVSGTVTISGAVTISSGTVNIGTVSGTVTITGSVSISGTPSVTISGTPTVAISGTITATISSGSVTITSGTITSITNNVAVYAPAQLVYSGPRSTLTGAVRPSTPLFAGARSLLIAFTGSTSAATLLEIVGTTSGIVYINAVAGTLTTAAGEVMYLAFDSTVDNQLTLTSDNSANTIEIYALGEPVALADTTVPGQPVGLNASLIAGSDSTDARVIRTDSSGRIVLGAPSANLPVSIAAQSLSPIVVSMTSTTITGTVTVSGTVTANQGTANTAANSWPVLVTDGTNTLGTSSHPVRVDPTGTTTQPVSLTSTTITGTVAVTQSTTPWQVKQSAKTARVPARVTVNNPTVTTTNFGPTSTAIEVTGVSIQLDFTTITLVAATTFSVQDGNGNALFDAALVVGQSTGNYYFTSPDMPEEGIAVTTGSSGLALVVTGTITTLTGSAKINVMYRS